MELINGITSIPNLLRGVSSTHQGNYYCLNCFHSYRTESTLKRHEEICINNKFTLIKMPTEDKKYIYSIPGKNTLKILSIIYTEFECLLYP